MIRKCEICPRTFDTNQKEPTRVGYGEQFNEMFPQYRKAFDLCEIHLTERILSDIEKSKTDQNAA